MENKIMKIKKHNNKSVKLVSAENQKLLFRHCADGHASVSPGKFEAVVKPLLLMHGVREIRFV